MYKDLNQLVQAIEEGASPEYLFFWGHKPAKNGRPGKSCFSQWWEAPFEVKRYIYPTAEHWMMAEKARLFKDEFIRQKILAALSPKEAKKLGRRVKGFSEELWREHRFSIVVEGNIHKFSQNPDLKEFLLSTGDKVLVEASPVDSIWGIGMAASASGASDPRNWKGANLLGFALMEVRERLG